MSATDRLSSLVQRFDLIVVPTEPEDANMFVFSGANGWRVVIATPRHSLAHAYDGETLSFCARFSWADDENPLFAGLPEELEHTVHSDDELALLLEFLIAEHNANRCGSGAVLNKLGEVLILRLFRGALERGEAETGALAGLSDGRISRVLVSIHEAPEKPWRIDDMADRAGLSRSRFMEVFHETVGESPQSYLRQWRMTLARQDLSRGDRVNAVARRYGYGSSEALNRAFKSRYGMSPKAFQTRIQ